MDKKIRVWDLPVRVFHWTLTAVVAAAIVTAHVGGNMLEWHFRCGYAVLALLLFRFVWGFAGSRYARFSDFLFSPRRIAAYIRNGMKEKRTGHNPLGSLSVFALLFFLLLQASSGLFSNDDIASEGPLAEFVGKEWSDRLSWFHGDVNAVLVYFLVGLHIAAILYYCFVKRRNLVTPMITGDIVSDAGEAPADDSARMRILAFVVFLGCVAFVYFIARLN